MHFCLDLFWISLGWISPQDVIGSTGWMLASVFIEHLQMEIRWLEA
jgi:hypothetical protein